MYKNTNEIIQTEHVRCKYTRIELHEGNIEIGQKIKQSESSELLFSEKQLFSYRTFFFWLSSILQLLNYVIIIFTSNLNANLLQKNYSTLNISYEI